MRLRIWLARALALAGLTLAVQVGPGAPLNALGVARALAGAVAYAVYVLAAERGLRRRDALSLSCFGFVAAALFWALLQPWWSFPAHLLDDRVSLLGNLSTTDLPAWILVVWMIVLGTIVPFGLIVGALRHVSATHVGVIAMIEPVAATLVAYAWLGESLAATQLVAGAIVRAGIVTAQTAR